ncbi:MAG: GFA family protein [Hyphomicrobiales bacterium]
MSNDQIRTGGCYCEAVTYTVNGPMRDVIVCHCLQYRKQSGHYYAATNAKKADVTISGEENITVFRASDSASRHFCSICGSALFWIEDDSETLSILAGSVNEPSRLKIQAHIFCADKGDYYELDDGLPQYPQSD